MSETFYDYNGIIAEYLTWYPLNEALGLLREAGFVAVQAHADFRFEPAAEDETSCIVLGKRPFSTPV